MVLVCLLPTWVTYLSLPRVFFAGPRHWGPRCSWTRTFWLPLLPGSKVCWWATPQKWRFSRTRSQQRKKLCSQLLIPYLSYFNWCSNSHRFVCRDSPADFLSVQLLAGSCGTYSDEHWDRWLCPYFWRGPQHRRQLQVDCPSSSNLCTACSNCLCTEIFWLGDLEA
jgi:hypothetical protein